MIPRCRDISKRVCEARDAGVTEFIVKPVTANSVLSRMQAVIFKPRPFVKSEGYNGPCRRRVNDPKFAGPYRRAGDSQRDENAA